MNTEPNSMLAMNHKEWIVFVICKEQRTNDLQPCIYCQGILMFVFQTFGTVGKPSFYCVCLVMNEYETIWLEIDMELRQIRK